MVKKKRVKRNQKKKNIGLNYVIIYIARGVPLGLRWGTIIKFTCAVEKVSFVRQLIQFKVAGRSMQQRRGSLVRLR
jgi:hypothetical protein